MNQPIRMLTEEFITAAINNPLEDQTCQQMHLGSCNAKALSQFVQGCRAAFKTYLIIHLVPLILFRRKKFKENPLQEIKKVILGLIKSLLFAGGGTMMVRRGICFLTAHYGYKGGTSGVAGVIGGLTILFESKSRRPQIALYLLNKGMQISYNMALRRQWRVNIPYGDCWLNAVAMSIICFTYMRDPELWRQSYRKGLGMVLGDI